MTTTLVQPGMRPSTPPRHSGLTRRRLLQYFGGASILIVGGLAYRGFDQGVLEGTTGHAYDPWRNWQLDGNPLPEALIGAAILAANPHNTQAWLFAPADDHIDVYGDTTRHSIAMDPASREFYIGLGCALENLALAAQAAGVTGRVALLPEPDQSLLVGRVDLTPAPPTQSPLYSLIGQRHVNRGPYDPARAVPAEALRELERLSEAAGVGVRWFTDSEERRRFGEITVAATKAFIADREQSEAAFAWFRGSPHEVEHYRDGLTLDTQGMSPGMLMLAKLAPSASREQGDQFWLTNTRDVHLASAPAFGMLLVEQPGALDWLRVGRAWQRMHLWATANNLALQPLDQTLQRAEREASLGLRPTIAARVTDLIATHYSAALPFRLGYPTQASVASPRRPVGTVLV